MEEIRYLKVQGKDYRISRRRTKGVKNPLPVPEWCHSCGCKVSLINNSFIYGKEYGDWPLAYMCLEGCGAYVGLHDFTDIPLGTLADRETRNARKKAKEIFNRLWYYGSMTRTDAYKWLAEKLRIANYEECHIGWFDKDTCNQVVTICKTKLETKGHSVKR